MATSSGENWTSKVARGVELPLKFETKTGELHSVNNEQGDGRKTSQTFE